MHVHCSLAPSYSGLDRHSVKSMDNELKLLISGTMGVLHGLRQRKELTWDAVTRIMEENQFLEESDNESVDREDSKHKSAENILKIDGSPEQAVVNEVSNSLTLSASLAYVFGVLIRWLLQVIDWFRRLINEEDVLDSTEINIDEYARLVAQTGARVTGIGDIASKVEEHSKRGIDVGLLRYPDVSRPFFKVRSTVFSLLLLPPVV